MARDATLSRPVPFDESATPAGGRDARRQAVFTVADPQGAPPAPTPPKLDPLEQSIVSEDMGVKAPQVGPVQATPRAAPPPAEQRSGGLFPGVTNPPAPAGADYTRAGGLLPGITGEVAQPPQAPPGQAGAVIPAPGAQGAATQSAGEAAGPPAMSPLEQEMAGIDAAARLSQHGAGGPGGYSSAAIALRDSNANLDAAVKNLQAEVLRKGTAGAAEGATQAYQQAAYADGLKQQSDAALRERQGLMDEVQRRGKLVDEASQQFATAMRGAPLGSALNPDSAMRVTGAIGLALGGALQGFRGGPNPALAIINTAIERDLQERRLAIEAGRAKMDATNQAYRTSYEVLGSWNAATEQMRANLLGQANLTRESISAQGLGDEKFANSKILGAELNVKMQEAKQAAATAAFKAVQAANRPQDPLKRIEQILKVKGMAADVAAKVAKAGEAGGEEQLKVGQMVVALRQARLPQFYEALAPLHETLSDPSKLPPNFLRAMQSEVDAAIARGKGDTTLGTLLPSILIKLNYTPEQAAQANRFINAWNKAVYSATGAAINNTEVGRIRRGAGMAPWGTLEELQAGLKSMEQDVRAQARVLRNANPKLFDRLMGANVKAIGVDEPTDSFDPSAAPQHGR
jgi:hypothetical protein